jgi:hypothetical protein
MIASFGTSQNFLKKRILLVTMGRQKFKALA